MTRALPELADTLAGLELFGIVVGIAFLLSGVGLVILAEAGLRRSRSEQSAS